MAREEVLRGDIPMSTAQPGLLAADGLGAVANDKIKT
jgi:hypothetical protein